MIQNTELESQSCFFPKEDCFDENGNIKKEIYMRQFPDFTKHDKKMTKKKILKFLEKNCENHYFRLEILDTPFGCVFHFLKDINQITEQDKDNFFKELWDAIDSCVINIKAFDFVSKNNFDAMEIWGIDGDNEPIIMFLYPYNKGVIEIGDEK